VCLVAGRKAKESIVRQGGAAGGRKALTWTRIAWILGLLLASAFVAYRWTVHHRVEKALDAIREAGYPVTPEELDAWYETPPLDENAAEVLMAAPSFERDALPTYMEVVPLVGNAGLPEPTAPLPKNMRYGIWRFLKENEQALQILHEGAQRPRCRWPIDLTHSFDSAHLLQLRYSVRMLVLDAIARADAGDSDGASQDVVDALKLASTLREEPTLMSQLVRLIFLEYATDGLEQVLNRATFNDDQLARLAKACADADPAGCLARGCAGQRCLTVPEMRSGDWGKGLVGLVRYPQAIDPFFRYIYRPLGLMDMDIVFYLETMEKSIDVSQAPIAERLPAADALRRRLDNVPPAHVVSSILLPVLHRAGTEELYGMARVRMGQAALAVERYRLSHGTLPNVLDEVVPEFLPIVPLDPFDANPIRFKRTEGGYAVYSVSQNREDDEGSEGPEENPNPWQFDLVLTVIRPE
jgi:hypothetical protein